MCFAALGGFSEFAARIPAAFSAISLCAAVAAVAYRYYGARAGLFAGLVQATCVYAFMQGRLGELDMVFASLVASALAVLAWHWGGGKFDLPVRSAILFHALVGLAILAKGPLAIILVGLPILGLCAVRSTLKPVRTVLFTPGIVFSLIVGFGWYVAIAIHLGSHAMGKWNYSYVARFFGGYHLNQAHTPLY